MQLITKYDVNSAFDLSCCLAQWIDFKQCILHNEIHEKSCFVEWHCSLFLLLQWQHLGLWLHCIRPCKQAERGPAEQTQQQWRWRKEISCSTARETKSTEGMGLFRAVLGSWGTKPWASACGFISAQRLVLAILKGSTSCWVTMESQNQWGWRRPLGSLRPTCDQTPPC